MSIDPGRLVREARSRAGISQRELARRAETSQSVVSRLEQGKTSPTVATLERILRAAGSSVFADLAPNDAQSSHMMDDVSRILNLTPEQRLLEIRNLSRFEKTARRV